VAQVLEFLQQNRDVVLGAVRRHRGLSAAVFGSVARGDDGAASDIDILVEFDNGSSLFDLLHLQQELEELLGRRVDVVSLAALKSRDSHIRAEAVAL